MKNLQYNLKTNRRQEFIDITRKINKIIKENNINDGIAILFVPHTTAGLTINENEDPDVVTDMLSSFNKNFPIRDSYLHSEGNSHAHIKASLMGSSETVIIESGKLKLRIWQGIYFCEFDGPRDRKVFVKIIED